MSSAPQSRRAFLQGATALAAGGLGAGALSWLANARGAGTVELVPQATEVELVPGTRTAVLSYGAGGPAPVLRVRQGQPMAARLQNRLEEPTTIHWHGIRLPLAMDGVPFLSQPVVMTGEAFDYAFTPPDAGSYWYHPHCNSLHQMSHGLTGLLIVEETNDPGFDADLPVNLRDWRLDGQGRFMALHNPRQTARAGTFGTVRSANWQPALVLEAPAGGLARVRLVVTDVTRVYRLSIADAGALIIASDGNPLPQPIPLENFAIGPGQRLDIVVAMPATEGSIVRVIDHSSEPAFDVVRLRSAGASRKRDLREVKALPPNPLPTFVAETATVIPIELSASPEQVKKSQFCGDLGLSFWAINTRAWLGSSPDPIAPLAEMKLGRSYVLALHNRTPHSHPIHLHGMSFKPLRSDRRPVLPVWTDTALLQPDERMDVALVADNPGDWLLHCHVIEHQETGMTGILRVV